VSNALALRFAACLHLCCCRRGGAWHAIPPLPLDIRKVLWIFEQLSSLIVALSFVLRTSIVCFAPSAMTVAMG